MDTNYLQEAFVDPVGYINNSYTRPVSKVYNEYNDYGLASPPRSPMETEEKLQKIVTPYAAHSPPAEYMTNAGENAGKKFNITNVESLLVIMFIIVFITIILTSSITAIICFSVFNFNKNANSSNI